MLSPKLKKEVRSLWDRFWSGGIANPLTAIEQITYLIFLMQLEERDNERKWDADANNREYISIYDAKYLFDIEPEVEGAVTSNAPLPESLLGRLESSGEVLDPETRAVQNATNGDWEITDGDNSYFIRSGADSVKVYKRYDGEKYRWRHIRELTPSDERLRHVRGPVFDWLKTLPGAEERMRDAAFVVPSANLLQGAVEIIDSLFVSSQNQDTLGDTYEELLREIAQAGKNGQFRTPRHIIRAMCDLVDPRYGERICDPACGTAGFLVNAYQHILKCSTPDDILKFEANGTPLYARGTELPEERYERLRRNHFYGWDFDRTMVRLGWMNMVQHGMIEPQVNYADTLGSRFNGRLIAAGASGAGAVGDFDVVLANPPFTGHIDKEDIGKSLKDLDTTKTELLFVYLAIQLLRPGGRAAVIVPEGLLFGSTKAHRTLRQKLIDHNQLNAVISLPGGVFQPYTGVKTSILYFTRGDDESTGMTEQVWFYEVAEDGYSLSAKRSEQFGRNDLWDMTLKSRLRFDKSYPQSRPAFVDGDTWRQWQAFDAESRRFYYLQPMLREVMEESEGEPIAVQELDGFETQAVDEAKTWEAERTILAENDYNLSAGRYKPVTLEAVDHDSPSQIIAELQEMEAEIQAGLAALLAMVENSA